MKLEVGSRFVLRTPLLPADTLGTWAADVAAGVDGLPALRARLEALLALPEVDEALLLASPSLHGDLARWRAAPDSEAGAALERTLVKYIARMAGRATPFGTFAGVSVGTIDRATALTLPARAAYARRTRIDNDYLFALAEQLGRDPELRRRLPLIVNSSLYEVGGRLRYAEARLEGKQRSYHLISVEPSPYLMATLERARGGAGFDELAAALVDDEISREEAETFVAEVIDAQLLVPALGVVVTGAEPLDAMVARLGDDVLDGVRGEIAGLDRDGLGQPRARYQAIADRLAALPAPVELGRLFQVDMVKPATATLGRPVVSEVQRAIDVLRRMSPQREHAGLAAFRRAFRERYEEREVPLAVALDEETGVGYEAATGPGSEGAPLLAGLRFPGREEPARVAWGARERHLLARVQRGGADELVLDDADLKVLAVAEPARLPDALSVMARVAGQGDQLRVMVEGVSGPSGARLLGRFCHAMPEIDALVREHLAAEEAQRPEAVYAEVVHLDEGRIGNVLCRPVLRRYELPYLGWSGADTEGQLGLDDLMVSVRGDRVVLRSRRLDREVLPRLSTAHNYRRRGLGVYRFLCDLQFQDGSGVGWSWGALDALPFTPRVRIGRAVLARARWRLSADELAPITAAVRKGTSSKVLDAIAALRAARGLPRHVVLADGDNELPIDLDNALLVLALGDELSGRRSTELVEQFPAFDALLATGPEGGFTHELILTFTRAASKEATAAAPRPRPAPAPAVARRFVPGSEWLYAKLYCGPATADRVLVDVVAPVVRAAMADGAADRWFFLRYNDPDSHIRLRLHGTPARLLGEVLPALERAAAPMLEGGAMWRIVLDTYEREVERYGGAHGIEAIEELFCADSEAVLAIVEQLEGDEGADARWRLALRGSERIAVELGLDAAARGALFASVKRSFDAEHRAGVDLHKQIGERYRAERAELERVVFAASGLDEHPLAPGIVAIDARGARAAAALAELRRRDAAGLLSPSLSGIAASLIHMHCNRLLHASQRAQELVLYNLLHRLHAGNRGGRAAEEAA